MIAFSLNSPLVFEHSFIGYSSEHFIILCFFCLSGLIYIQSLGKLSVERQHRILFISAIVLALVQLSRIPILAINGQFNIETDLPLHLCNFLPFAMIWSYGVRSEKIWSVMVFWIMLGCSQANFTPAVRESLFYYDAIRYWVVHAFLVILCLYPAINWNWKIKHIDIWRSLGWLHIVSAIIYSINLATGGNYMYLNAKPAGTNFYSILPEWPYYILSLEFVILALSYLLFGIFTVISRNKNELSPKSAY